MDHPQSNAQTERVNHIEDMLRAYVVTSAGYSPFMLMYGFQPRAPIDVNICHHDELQSTQNFLRDMQDMLHIARDNIKTAQDRVCFYACHYRPPHVFKLRNKVFLHLRVSVLSQPHCFVDLSQSSNTLVHQPIVSLFLKEVSKIHKRKTHLYSSSIVIF